MLFPRHSLLLVCEVPCVFYIPVSSSHPFFCGTPPRSSVPFVQSRNPGHRGHPPTACATDKAIVMTSSGQGRRDSPPTHVHSVPKDACRYRL